MNELFQNEKKWIWSSKCTQAVQTAKQLLTASNILTHYDPTLPLKLAVDASQYGLGAVISHVLPGGEEKPIAFASRSLSKSEQNYAQIDKEALALIYGVQKFHTYIFGRKFTLVTDHQPLTIILGPKKGIPSVAAARLQRWAILLSAYTYDIEFRNTPHMEMQMPYQGYLYLGRVLRSTVMQCETIGIIASDQSEDSAIHSTRPCSQQSVILYTQGMAKSSTQSAAAIPH